MEFKKVVVPEGYRSIFTEEYEAETERLNPKNHKYEKVRIWVCLDDYCVRYVVNINGKKKSVREFGNEDKQKCWTNAHKALERYSR